MGGRLSAFSAALIRFGTIVRIPPHCSLLKDLNYCIKGLQIFQHPYKNDHYSIFIMLRYMLTRPFLRLPWFRRITIVFTRLRLYTFIWPSSTLIISLSPNMCSCGRLSTYPNQGWLAVGCWVATSFLGKTLVDDHVNLMTSDLL